MRVLLSTYGSHGEVDPMVGRAVQLWALGAALPRHAVEGCDALMATGVMPAGVRL
jgi:hypothetical protein